MTNQARTRRTALAINGAVKVPKYPTNLSLATPAENATNPFTRVARPNIEDNSVWETPSVLDDEMSHESKAENRMEVDIPPNTRPANRIGKELKSVQAQARV